MTALLTRLFEEPESADLIQIIPEGTAILSWSIQDGMLKLDLSEAFDQLSGISLTQAEYCIVLTVCQLEEVDTVTLTVAGQSLPNSSGSPMSVSDVVLRGETEDPITIGTQLYFPLTGGSGLGVEYREIEIAAQTAQAQAEAILKALAQGPSEDEMTGFLSSACVLEVIQIQDGLCIVEMDSATLECICSPEEQYLVRLYSIVDSLIELESVDSVSFLLDGEAIEGWQEEHTALYEFE